MASLANADTAKGLPSNLNTATSSLATTKGSSTTQGSQLSLHDKQHQGHPQPQQQQQARHQQQQERRQENFPVPWDLRIPTASGTDTTLTSHSFHKGFDPDTGNTNASTNTSTSTNTTTNTWPHFRSKPHPTLTVPITPPGMSHQSMQFAAQSDDSDNPMCTPTFDSFRPSFSRRNSTASTTMALDTPPPLSLMDLEALTSFQGHSSNGSGASSNTGSASASSAGSVSSSTMASTSTPQASRTTTATTGGYPFPLFSRSEPPSTPTRRNGFRANSISMESGHARKASEDANMSDGGSGTERGRRRSPTLVPFERSVRRSALLPKPKGLLKVFTQLEEEAHHNRHEYDHEREVTRLRKTTQDAMMDIGGALISPGLPRQAPRSPSPFGMVRRPSTSKLNPDQELQAFQRQQEEFDRLFQDALHNQEVSNVQALGLGGGPFQPQSHPMAPTMSSSSSTPSSPLLGPIVTRSKRKSSTSEERFDPYHSSHLKRRAVSPSIGPIVGHRASPSGSPARSHLQGHGRAARQTGMVPPLPLFPGATVAGSVPGQPVNRTNGSVQTSGPSGITPGVNMQHTSRSFSEMSLGMSSKTQQHP